LIFIDTALAGIKVVQNAVQDWKEGQGLGVDHIGHVTNQPQPKRCSTIMEVVGIFLAIRSLREILVGFWISADCRTR
jgi:hypothetical protein